MSIPEREASGALPLPAGTTLEALAAQAAGAPDPALIARLAGELLQAWSGPGGAVPPSPAPYPAALPTPFSDPVPSLRPSPSLPATPPGPPGAPAPTSPPAETLLPPAAASPNVMPTADQLQLVPRAHMGLDGAVSGLPYAALPPGLGQAAPVSAAAAPAAPATAGPSAPTSAPATSAPVVPVSPAPPSPFAALVPGAATAPVTGPGEAYYFLDEGRAAGTRVPELHLESLEPEPEAAQLGALRVPGLGLGVQPFDPRLVRRDFPILEERVHGKPLVWLDNAATTQKPNAVIDRLSRFYREENSNIHRAAHALAARATDAYEAAREKVRRFLGAGSTEEIVFVRGATEAINLVAQSWGRRNVGEGDEIVVTHLEHHANIVPWQLLCAEKGARLRVAPVNDRGELVVEEFERLLGPRTRVVAVTQVSNALGTVVPVQVLTEAAHRHGARVLVDGAQAVSHLPVDVQALGCDWYVFSGHKVFGPTGIGVVYGRKDVLEAAPPWQGGGNMIADVTFEKTVYQPAPAKFEAGTGNIADAVGLGAALDYLLSLGRENVARYEHGLLAYATQGLLTVPGLKIIGTAPEKAGVVSFVLDGVRSEDVGAALDREGIAVRSGHHCAQPILRRFGLESTVRPSFAPYNLCEDVDALVAALHRLVAGRGR